MKSFMFTKIISLATALVLLLMLSACGSKPAAPASPDAPAPVTTVTVATSPDFPPFEYLDGTNVVGIEVDILKAIADKLGYELVIEQMDFESVVPGVQAGKFDIGMSGITITEARLKNCDFTQPYFLASQAIVVTKDSAITCKADLDGKKISVQTGTTAEEYCLDEGYAVSAFAANNDAASALTTGKVDAWVVDNEVAIALAAQQDLVVLSDAMTQEPYGFAFAKGSALCAEFDAALSELLADGSIEAIFNDYDAIFVSPLNK